MNSSGIYAYLQINYIEGVPGGFTTLVMTCGYGINIDKYSFKQPINRIF